VLLRKPNSVVLLEHNSYTQLYSSVYIAGLTHVHFPKHISR